MFMGVYELSAETDDGAPRFVKRLANGKAQYLSRAYSDGTWGVTDDESNIATTRGTIFSLRAAELPSEAELGWKYYDGSFKNDPDLRCTDVRTHGHHRSGRRETTSRPTGQQPPKLTRHRQPTVHSHAATSQLPNDSPSRRTHTR